MSPIATRIVVVIATPMGANIQTGVTNAIPRMISIMVMTIPTGTFVFLIVFIIGFLGAFGFGFVYS